MKFLNDDSNQICPKQGSELRRKSHLHPSLDFCWYRSYKKVPKTVTSLVVNVNVTHCQLPLTYTVWRIDTDDKTV